jgi:hypothetical protein
MGNARGVRRDFAALKRRRLAALKFLKQGYNQSEVARRVKVCSQTVSRCARAVAAQGDKALSAAGRAGRKPLLDNQQRERLIARLLEGPARLGYETPLAPKNYFRYEPISLLLCFDLRLESGVSVISLLPFACITTVPSRT